MAKAPTTAALPDWWQREKQRRQVVFLIFLALLLTLIGYFYVISNHGRIGRVSGIDFDSTNYIAFVHRDKSGAISLYAVRGDGTDARRLTTADDVSNKQDPAWTLDGKNLLYATNRGDNSIVQIYVLGSGEPRQLTYGTGNKFAPIASPDGKHAAFVTQGAIKTVLLNGNDVAQVIPPPRAGNEGEGENGTVPGEIDLRGAYQTARFSSDGRGIAGVQSLSSEENPMDAAKLGDQVIRALPPDGQRAEILDFGREVSAAWEPNGNRLACAFSELQMADTSGPNGLVSGIHLWQFGTGNKRPEPTVVLLSAGQLIEPKNIAWSPDGKTLAFELWALKGPGERELLGIATLPITASVKLTKPEAIPGLVMLATAIAEARPQNPVWSPDGSRLLYELSRPDGGHDLCVVNSDGTGRPINLTAALGGDNTQGVWSPEHK